MLGTVLMCVLIGMLRQSSTQLCPLCDCCKNNNCVMGVECPDGCIDGYWDDDQHKDCRNPCLPGCLRCTNGTVCDACKDGYYGPTCEECTSPCKTCSGTTCLTCIDGRYGDQCTNLCLSECKTCDDNSSCLTCVDGKYGNRCEHECHTNCKTCNSFSKNDCTGCQDGVWHINCRQPCGAGCKDGVCYFNGTCECTEMFTGDSCIECIAGRYGATCDLYCQEVCHRCDIHVHCLSCKPGYNDPPDCTTCPNRDCLNDVCLTNGKCQACTKGHYGEQCNEDCPSNCYQQTCNRYSGNCNSCKNRYFGATCDNECPDKCTTCSSGTYCTSCIAGYYGTTCEHQCPGNCICDSSGQCTSCKNGYNNTNKQCQCEPRSHACTDTMYEDGSDTICCPCSSNCKDSKCSSETSCTNGCIDGLFGLGCSNDCSGEDKYCEKCILNGNRNYRCTECANGFYANDNGRCINCSNGCLNGQCNSSTGFCTDGCKEIFWSNRCDNTCRGNCTTCERQSGKCTMCKTGNYGDDCSLTCPSNCEKHNDPPSCYMNGTCALGCLSNATFGPHCNIKCDEHCLYQTCDFETGDCFSGCIDGFVQSGNLCNKALPTTDQCQQTPAAAIVGPLVAIIVILTCIIGILAYCVWKRNKTILGMNNAEDKFEVTYENALEQSSGNETNTDAGHNNYDSLSNREDKTGYTTIQAASDHTVGDYYNVRQ